MKTLSILLITCLTTLSTVPAHAFDWKSLLKKNEKDKTQTEQTSTNDATDKTSEDPKSSLLSGLASFIDDASGHNKLDAKDLVGTWEYDAPAVVFISDNTLQKAGGVAASAIIIDKIKPYYERFKLDRVVFTFNNDSTMSMGFKHLSINGVYTHDEDGTYTFDLQLKGHSIKKLHALISRRSKNICITFNAAGLISLMNTVASLTGNAATKGLAELLNTYEGMTVGFELAKKSE